jgi:hypothetical protein
MKANVAYLSLEVALNLPRLVREAVSKDAGMAALTNLGKFNATSKLK